MISNGRTLAALTGLTTLAATQLDHALIVGVVLPFLGTLLAMEVDRGSATLASALVRGGARLLPRADREVFRDQWIDHIKSAEENGLEPLTRALSIAVLGVPLLAIGLRIGRRRRFRRPTGR